VVTKAGLTNSIEVVIKAGLTNLIEVVTKAGDHLSYVTIFQCSLGRSHKTGLTVIAVEYNSYSEECVKIGKIRQNKRIFIIFLKCTDRNPFHVQLFELLHVSQYNLFIVLLLSNWISIKRYF
jgi:hypothetical protein